ncbi:MAG: hypothetical protein JEZ14_03220 [Marinilabiliaceae bacterium]|nr:hypothetical protein [Marinilabiliaceae bacterium]
MIVYLRLLSIEADDFVKEIAIDDNQTFADLHNFLQELLEYDATQMASFFTTDSEWNKEQEVTLFDMTDGETENILVMNDTKIAQLITEAGQRLLYVFDLFSERAFFIETIQTAEGTLAKPNCYKNQGETPQQIMIGDISEDTVSEEPDFDESLLDDFNCPIDLDEFNDESFDENDFPDHY